MAGSHGWTTRCGGGETVILSTDRQTACEPTQCGTHHLPGWAQGLPSTPQSSLLFFPLVILSHLCPLSLSHNTLAKDIHTLPNYPGAERSPPPSPSSGLTSHKSLSGTILFYNRTLETGTLPTEQWVFVHSEAWLAMMPRDVASSPLYVSARMEFREDLFTLKSEWSRGFSLTWEASSKVRPGRLTGSDTRILSRVLSLDSKCWPQASLFSRRWDVYHHEPCLISLGEKGCLSPFHYKAAPLSLYLSSWVTWRRKQGREGRVRRKEVWVTIPNGSWLGNLNGKGLCRLKYLKLVPSWWNDFRRGFERCGLVGGGVPLGKSNEVSNATPSLWLLQIRTWALSYYSSTMLTFLIPPSQPW